MNRAPERPHGVPADAHWIAEEQEWEHGGLSVSQAKHGLVRYWREDGSLKLECNFQEGIPHGPYKRFHKNGAVTQEGQFQDGSLHSTCVWYYYDEPASSQPLNNDLSKDVHRTEIDYEQGRILATRFFNRSGIRICSDGSFFPSIPSGVPSNAEYRPDSQTWCHGPLDEQNLRTGEWNVWNSNGDLTEVTSFQGGVPHGSHFEQVLESQRFLDPEICIVKGSFEYGQAIGQWLWLDAHETIRTQIDFGHPCNDTQLLQLDVFADTRKTHEEWTRISQELVAQGLFCQALCAQARASASCTKISGLLELLQHHCAPLSPYGAQRLAATLLEKGGDELRIFCNGLIRGAEAVSMFREIGLALSSLKRNRAALDYLNAAILLDPSGNETLSARATVLLHLGLEQHAAVDAQALALKEPEESSFLQAYGRILFPVFDFWPSKEEPSTCFGGLPNFPAQVLDSIQQTIQKYATRLLVLRQKILQFAYPQTHWMVPDLSFLLPHGPVRLDVLRVDIAFVSEDGTESTKAVQVNEALDVEGWDLLSLMHLARCDWNALTWLCWSIGLNQVAMPDKIRAPKKFGEAAGMSAEKLSICRNALRDHEKEEEGEKHPGFTWEGIAFENLSKPLLRIAESQYAEMQAMFKWLAFVENQSPWQEDLRES